MARSPSRRTRPDSLRMTSTRGTARPRTKWKIGRDVADIWSGITDTELPSRSVMDSFSLNKPVRLIALMSVQKSFSNAFCTSDKEAAKLWFQPTSEIEPLGWLVLGLANGVCVLCLALGLRFTGIIMVIPRMS